MSKTKLTEEEVKSLNELQQKNAALVNELGTISLAEISLVDRSNAAKSFLKELRSEERELAKSLEEKYGAGQIDLKSGEFIAATKEEEVVSAE